MTGPARFSLVAPGVDVSPEIRDAVHAQGGELVATLREASGEWIAVRDHVEGDDITAVDLTADCDVLVPADGPVRELTGRADLDLSRAYLRRTAPRGLDLDERVGPAFAGAHLVARVLLDQPKLRAGRLTGRPPRPPRVDRGHPGVIRHGYLDLLRRSRAEWVQRLVLVELAAHFAGEQVSAGQQLASHLDEFRALLAELAHVLDPDAVARHLPDPVWREILLHGDDPARWHTPEAVVDAADPRQATVRVTYRFTHERPAETWRVDGIRTAPLHAKVRDEPYFGWTAVHERIAWLPAGELSLHLDAAPVELRVAEPAAATRREPSNAARRVAAELRRRVVTGAAGSALARRRFAEAWVLMDRVHDADDSAEHLFSWLRRHRPEINAWFVVGRDSADYVRLRRRYRTRIVAYGSLRWKVLMLACVQLVSSHADVPITDPDAVLALAPKGWRFAFLQHGVTKDDLSPWLNGKAIDVFVTSTPAEYHSVVDDGTAYRYTTRETVLTGLPRFDALLAAAAHVQPDARDLLLVAPTWRSWLARADRRQAQSWFVDGFADSDFAREWQALLAAPELKAATDEHGVRVALLMHPNLQAVAGQLELPSHVERLDFADVRHTFARTRLLVTDYSSTAFNAAYLGRPVVYYQFDRERMFGGAHVGRRGYFDYDRDGFGPVTETVVDALAATIDTLARGLEPAYAARIDAAFPLRDGRCCERAADAVAASLRRVPWPPPH